MQNACAEACIRLYITCLKGVGGDTHQRLCDCLQYHHEQEEPICPALFEAQRIHLNLLVPSSTDVTRTWNTLGQPCKIIEETNCALRWVSKIQTSDLLWCIFWLYFILIFLIPSESQVHLLSNLLFTEHLTGGGVSTIFHSGLLKFRPQVRFQGRWEKQFQNQTWLNPPLLYVYFCLILGKLGSLSTFFLLIHIIRMTSFCWVMMQKQVT